jgi:hypothetical protein
MQNDFNMVILFNTTHAVMWARKLLVNENIQHKLIAVPRHLSSDCGYCINFNSSQAENISKIISDAGLAFNRIEML